MSVDVGTAPDSWGVWFAQDPKQIPWQRYLDEAVEAGYRWTELGPVGYMPTDPALLRGEFAKRGLGVTAACIVARLDDPAARPEIEKQLHQAGPLLNVLGGKFMVLIDDTYTDLFTGKPRWEKRLDAAGWERVIGTVSSIAKLARERYGLRLVFHPHAETRIEHEDQIEELMRRTDPALVEICLDTGHHAYHGADPAKFFRKHHQRIPYLHLKSVDHAVRDRVAAQGLPFAHAVANDMFCEPERGAVDFEAMRDAMRDVGYRGFAIVEQDMYPAPFDKPLPIAKRTRAYLKRVGIG